MEEKEGSDESTGEGGRGGTRWMSWWRTTLFHRGEREQRDEDGERRKRRSA